MTMFISPHGVEVSAAEAKIGGKLRPGFKEILADGEYLHTNILLMDAKPKGDETSIDAALREQIATLAKGQGLTPEQYLAATPFLQLQKMAAEVASNVLETMSGQGVASKLADQRARDATEILRKQRYSGYGKFIEAGDTDNPVRPTIPTGMAPTDAVAYLRKARYA